MDVINTIGRRKTSVARLYMTKGSGKMTINGRESSEYFPLPTLIAKLNQPFEITETVDQYDCKINVDGGGFNGQAEAIRLAVSRALVQEDEERKPSLKAQGLMSRDPRMVERKKPGQKKARKKFQFSKR